jgi:hypothetical protein
MANQTCPQCNGKGATLIATQEIQDRYANSEVNSALSVQGTLPCQQCGSTGVQRGHYPGTF